MKHGIVVGAEAAGVILAGRAVELGVNPLLLGKMGGIGNRLSTTSSARCNLANICEIREFIHHPLGLLPAPQPSALFPFDLSPVCRAWHTHVMSPSGDSAFWAFDPGKEISQRAERWRRER